MRRISTVGASTRAYRGSSCSSPSRVKKTEKLKPLVLEIGALIKTSDRDYRQENYSSIVKRLEIIGDKCTEAKKEFRKHA